MSTTTAAIPGIPAGMDPLTYAYFHYNPNAPAAIVGLVVFALIASLITFRYIRLRQPTFMLKLIPLSTIETIGFVLRIVCIYNGVTLPKYLVMNIFMLLCPNILAFMNYGTVNEIIITSGIESPKIYLQPKKIFKFFLACTIFTSAMQATGGGLQTVPSLRDIGMNLTIAGMSVQLGLFALFSVLLVYVALNDSINYQLEGVTNPKRGAITRVSIGLTLLTIRIIYRLAQFGTGAFGPISVREWVLYVFDALIVAACFLLYTTLSSCFPKRGKDTSNKTVDEESVRKLNTNTKNDYAMKESL